MQVIERTYRLTHKEHRTMAVDPKKLAAFAGGGNQPIGMPPKGGAPGGGGGGGKPPKGGTPGGKSPHDAHPDMNEGDETDGDESDELPPELKQFANVVKLLESNGEDVEEQCEGLDQEFLTDASAEPDDDEKQELTECLDALPDDLVAAMKSQLKGVSHDDALAIADHLEDEGFITDAECVGGFLFHCGQVYDGGGDADADDDDDADMDDDEDDDADYE